MKRTAKRAALAVIWVLSLILVVTYLQGQNQQSQSNILTGTDLGFKLDYVQSGRAVGNWMVKVNNVWVPVGSVPGIRTLGN